MAKSNGFFGMRRGSAGSLTFSVLNGQQITKQKVSSVTNPKSTAQTVQRMKLAPAQRFYDAFNMLLNHSFQNINYGNKSRQYFMSEAMKQNGGPYVAKGVQTIIPGSYLISKGSQGTVTTVYNHDGNYRTNIRLTLKYGNISSGNKRTHDEFVQDVLNSNPWIKEGQKLTIMCIGHEDDEFGDHYFPYYIQIVLSPNGETGAEETFTDGWEWLSEADINVDGYFEFDQEYNYLHGHQEGTKAAAGVIISSGTKSDDLRTTSRMAVDDATYELFYSEMAYRYAIASYQDTAAVQIGDEWILNTLTNGLYGRVVARTSTILLGGSSKTIQYLALVYEIAGDTQTRVFKTGSTDQLVGTDGQALKVWSRNQWYIITIDQLEAGEQTIEWNSAYLSLFNGSNYSASAAAVTPIRPIEKLLDAPAKLLEQYPEIYKMVIFDNGLICVADTYDSDILKTIKSTDEDTWLYATVENGVVTAVEYGEPQEPEEATGLIENRGMLLGFGSIDFNLTVADFVNVKEPVKLVDFVTKMVGESTEENSWVIRKKLLNNVDTKPTVIIARAVANDNLTLAVKETNGTEAEELQEGDVIFAYDSEGNLIEHTVTAQTMQNLAEFEHDGTSLRSLELLTASDFAWCTEDMFEELEA